MKFFFNNIKLILIIGVIIGLPLICFAANEPDLPNMPMPKNYAEDVKYSDALLKSSNKYFDEVINRINQNFKQDTAFLKLFNNNVNQYKASRMSEINIIFPHNQNYGVARESTTAYFNLSLNRNKLKEYEKLINYYCLRNEFFYTGDECSDAKIEQLFK